MTFRIIGDNVDVHQKPRYTTADHKSKGYHWFHVYAVKNRVNAGNYILRTPCNYANLYTLIGKYSMWFSFPNMLFWNDLWISAHISEDIPVGSLEDANAALFMPSPSDHAAVWKDFLVLVANVLVQYVSCLRIFQDYVLSHIPHKFSSEMSKASEIASLTKLF